MYKCKFCSKEYKTRGNIKIHERTCKSNPDRDTKEYSCRYCGRKTIYLKGNSQHEIFCSKNPDNHLSTFIPWNRGLTKETSDTIAIAAKNFSDRVKNGEVLGGAGRKGQSNFSCNIDVKKKISDSMKGNHNNNPNKTGRGKKGWYKGFFCSSTYELALVIYCIDHNIDIQRCNYFYEYMYEGKQRRYYPDFIINDTIVEVKGYHTAQVDAKTSAVKDRPIKVLYRENLKPVFDYIYTTYGKVVDNNISELYDKMGN